MAIAGSILLLVGAALWTVIIKKAEAINIMEVSLNGSSVPLGINVSVGIGLYLLWASFAVLAISIVPYMLRYVSYVIYQDYQLSPILYSCCTYRG